MPTDAFFNEIGAKQASIEKDFAAEGVADEFEETTQRQRELTRAYQIATGRRSEDDGPGERGIA